MRIGFAKVKQNQPKYQQEIIKKNSMTKKRGLSSTRGLDVLMGSIKKEKAVLESVCVISDEPTGCVGVGQTADVSDEPSLIHIEIARLQSGKYQPRRAMSDEALAELSASIAKHGVMQPIVIRPLLASEEGQRGVTHEIIAGERRWRAAKMAGLTTIPAIHRVLTDEIAIALALIENIQREDLSVLEQAQALERFHTEFGMSHTMIAEVVGKARTTVSNLLRLNALHDTVKAYMSEGKLDMGHARALLSLSAQQQPIIASKIIDGNMTVREAERLVKSILNPISKTIKSKTPEIEKMSQTLSDKLGAKVKLTQTKDGKGSMEIFFQSDDELLCLLKQLQLTTDE